ncbi:MAG: response regulator [Bacteroidia bacterium]|nr:response regulator [Bacteroidia bacterium]
MPQDLTIRCLVVDDEPLAHRVIQNYGQRLEYLTLVGHCYHAVEAINFLHQQPVDLLLLDIQMPEITSVYFLKENHSTHKVFFADICYIQAYGNYLKVFTNEDMIMISDTLKNFAQSLPADDFVQVHKSYLVNFAQIRYLLGNRIFIRNTSLPIGAKYKLFFEQRYQGGGG